MSLKRLFKKKRTREEAELYLSQDNGTLDERLSNAMAEYTLTAQDTEVQTILKLALKTDDKVVYISTYDIWIMAYEPYSRMNNPLL
jgi:hypothetical protein